eukprot:TCONS_00042057-protein
MKVTVYLKKFLLFRGLPSNQNEAFRKAYGEIGNLRAMYSKKFMCLTATANKKTTRKIVQLLHLRNHKITRLSPEKPNVKISVKKLKQGTDFQEIIDHMRPMVEDLNQKGSCQKTIIYCNSIALCGKVFLLFDRRYRGKAVGMFHGHTPQELKEIVMTEFSKNNGKCFIVVATSALGMGVNIRNVRHVIHVGLPSDVEAYIQELGRAGRDGDQSSAFLFYRPCDIAHNADEELVRIIKNKEEKCRRVALLKCFNEVPDNDFDNEKHKCCDECEKMCKCDECAVPKEEITPPKLKSVRSADDEEKETILACLVSLTLSNEYVELVMENVNCIQTETDLLTLGLDESVSMFVSLVFKEVFYIDNLKVLPIDDTKKDDIDILSMKQPYKEKSNDEIDFDSDNEIFWQDFF